MVPSSNWMVTTVEGVAAAAGPTAQEDPGAKAPGARAPHRPLLHWSEQARGLAGERQRAGRGQVQRRLDRRERLDVVLELGGAVELRERVAVIRRAVPHPGQEPLVEGAVGALHG